MTHLHNETTERADPAGRDRRAAVPARLEAVETTDRLRGLVAFGIAGLCWSVWIAWRVTTMAVAPIQLAMLSVELVGAATLAVTVYALSRTTASRKVFESSHATSHRYAHAVADFVERTRSVDVRSDLLTSACTLRSADAGRADWAMFAVLLEGPRRLAMVIVVVVGLLVGSAPIGSPPISMVACVIAATCAGSVSTWLLTGRRARPGSRTRWSFAAMGESLSPAHTDDVTPRHWVGTVGAIVALNVAIGLRGASDRWTHGLSPMTDDARVFTVGCALAVVVGALYTLRSLPSPAPNTVFVSRHLEEGTARQAAIASAVVVGALGLFAGVLLGGDDPVVDDPITDEIVTNSDSVEVELGGGG